VGASPRQVFSYYYLPKSYFFRKVFLNHDTQVYGLEILAHYSPIAKFSQASSSVKATTFKNFRTTIANFLVFVKRFSV
jgi:hypothetical protein